MLVCILIAARIIPRWK